jgi:hypothetical protein
VFLKGPRRGRLEYLHRSIPANSKRRQKGTTMFLGDITTGSALQVEGISNETIKCGTSTQEWLLWQGPEANVQVNYRPILSSERVPHTKKPEIIRQKTKIWAWAPDGSPTARQTGRLTVGRNLTTTSDLLRSCVLYGVQSQEKELDFNWEVKIRFPLCTPRSYIRKADSEGYPRSWFKRSEWSAWSRKSSAREKCSEVQLFL